MYVSESMHQVYSRLMHVVQKPHAMQPNFDIIAVDNKAWNSSACFTLYTILNKHTSISICSRPMPPSSGTSG